LKKLWNGSIDYNNNYKSHGGVAILIHNRWKDHIVSLRKDNTGRIISVNFVDGDIDFDILSVYAPNNRADKVKFIAQLSNFITDKDKFIGRDFNTTFCNIDLIQFM